MAYPQTQGVTSPMPTTPAGIMPQGAGTSGENSKLAKHINEEYHDPYDDWSSRDILLALVPFIVALAFKDTNLRAGLAFATAAAWFLIIMRTVAWDSRRKTIWPLIDLVGIFMWPILLGMTYVSYVAIHRWINVIAPAAIAFAIILTLLWRRPFSAHYARYPKFDRGGSGLWHGDRNWRAASDGVSMGWAAVFSIMCLISLIPILTQHWRFWHSLNVLFNYIVPAVLLLFGLIQHQLMGSWYRRKASQETGQQVSGGTASYPAGSGTPSEVPGGAASAAYSAPAMTTPGTTGYSAV